MSDLEKSDSPRLSHTEDISIRPEKSAEADRPEIPLVLRTLSPEEYAAVGRRAVLKMDTIIPPCLMLMYILNYLDRNNIASTQLARISTDLHLTETQYQSCISILFVGYSKTRSFF